MTFDCSQRREQDDQSYLTSNNGVLHDAILEGQFAMRSALQHDSARPVRGILAFNLPSLRSKSRHPHGTANHDELVAEPEPDFTRSWVSDHQARQREFYATVQGSTSSRSSLSSTPIPSSPLEYLDRPNVRGIRLENARPSHIGLEILWFLRSLTNGDVRKICLALEQTLWTGDDSKFQDPIKFLDSLANGSVMEVPDATSHSVQSIPDYTYILDFARNVAVVYDPDGRKYEIELRSWNPQFLADVSGLVLRPDGSGAASNSDSSELSSTTEEHSGYFDRTPTSSVEVEATTA